MGRGLPGGPADRGNQDRPLRPPSVGRPQGPRSRGVTRIATDVDTRAAAINLARLAVLGVAFNGAGWTSNSG